MKELLLLTLSIASLTLKSIAAPAMPYQTSPIISTAPKDTLAEQLIKGNPRAGFKDLFDNDMAAASGIHTAHLNPQAISFVQGYIQQHSQSLNRMKSWGKPYFDMMDNILTRYGLPNELKYLAVIESDLKSAAVSWAGAVGPWQFMPETGRRLGLRIGNYTDERTDFYKSTHAAARYLSELYGNFNDWLLVIAAYNCGPGVVNSAIRKSGSRNFWRLQYYLPEESRNHVKKFIATHYIMEGEGGETTLTRQESNDLILNKQPETDNTNISLIEIAGGSKYSAAAIANYVQMNIVDFNKLNPNFDKVLAATAVDKTVNLRLPSDKVLLFQANKPQILEQSMRLMLSLN